MPMAKREIISAVLLLVFSGLYIWATQYIPDRTIPNTPGPSFFPIVIVSILIVLSVSLLIKGLIRLRAESGVEALAAFSRTAFWMLVSFALFLGLLQPLGFLTASIPFYASLMVLYGCQEPVKIAIWSIAVPTALYLLFTQLFQVLLPTGLLGF